MADIIYNSIRKILNNRIFLNSSLISIITFGEGAINFLFTLIIGRLLGQGQYGIYNPLVSLLVIITIPGLALQMVFSSDISRLIHHDQREALRDYLKKVFYITVFIIFIILGILIISLPFLKGYFRISDDRPFLMLCGLVALNLFAVPFQSLIQSREDYKTYVLFKLIALLSKFSAGVLMVYFFLNYLGALGGLIVSLLVSIIFLMTDLRIFMNKTIGGGRPAREGMDKNPGYIGTGRILKSFATGFLSVFAFQIIMYLDTILVRHYLTDLSGIYSMVNQFGKASFFIASSISFVMLPFMSKDRVNIVRSNLLAFLFLFSCLILFCFVIVFISPFLSGVIFAGKFPGMEKVLPVYVFMFMPYALIYFLINYYIISQKLFYSLAIFTGVILQFIGIVLFHKDLIQVSLVIGSVGYFVLAVLSADSFFWHDRKKVFNLV